MQLCCLNHVYFWKYGHIVPAYNDFHIVVSHNYGHIVAAHYYGHIVASHTLVPYKHSIVVDLYSGSDRKYTFYIN